MNTPLPIHTLADGLHAGITTITLTQPNKPVVVLDHDLIRQLDATLDRVPSTSIGLVLASAAPRAFVAGADLKSITQLDDPALHAYLSYAAGVFARLASLPFPTVAAIHAAALGGGLELAMHCDGLVASPPPLKDGQPGRPYPVGLPEAGLSICPGWGGTNLLPARTRDPADAIRRTITGTPLPFDQAVAQGLFDAVAPTPDALLPTAMDWLKAAPRPGSRGRDGSPSRWIGRPGTRSAVLAALDVVKAEHAASDPASPAAAILACVDVGLTQGWDAAIARERAELVRLRHTPAARAAIAAFFAKS